MRIALIAHSLRAGGGISVGRNLIAALGRVAPEHQYFASIPAGLAYEDVCSSIPKCQTMIHQHQGYFKRWLFDTRELPVAVRAFCPDVVLGLGNSTLRQQAVPQAVLCHDPHLWYPRKHFAEEGPRELRRRAIRWVKRVRFQQSLSRADLVFCQTQTALSRLCTAYQYSGPTAICPNAVSHIVTQGAAPAELPNALRPFAHHTKLFCLARYYPHKNLEMLVRVFDRFRCELEDHVLVLTVSPEHGQGAERLLKTIDELGLGEQIINVGPLDQAQLASFYTNCDALLMPSFLESFSATYVEAMHFGCPILTSDLDFAREICGDAAIYFDPWNAESILSAIKRLASRSDLPDLGREHLQHLFRSWDQIAADLLGDLQTIAGSQREES